MDLSRGRSSGAALPHQRLSALCSPHFSGEQKETRGTRPLQPGWRSFGCLTIESRGTFGAPPLLVRGNPPDDNNPKTQTADRRHAVAARAGAARAVSRAHARHEHRGADRRRRHHRRDDRRRARGSRARYDHCRSPAADTGLDGREHSARRLRNRHAARRTLQTRSASATRSARGGARASLSRILRAISPNASWRRSRAARFIWRATASACAI